MRTIINISLPLSMAKEVKKEVKEGGFASVSEFFRHILRTWKEKKLYSELQKNKKEFEAGKGKILHSLSDLD